MAGDDAEQTPPMNKMNAAMAKLKDYQANIRSSEFETTARRYYELYLDTIVKLPVEQQGALQEEFNRIQKLRVDTAALFLRLTKPMHGVGLNVSGIDLNTTRQQNTINVVMPQQAIINTYFDGDFMKWKGFRDRFKAAVHDKVDMKPAEKFAQLKSSLKGKAADAFGDWELNEASYQDAYDRSNKLYDRPYIVCTEHIHQLFKLPILRKPATSAELQHMANTTHEQLRQLKANGIPVDKWDMIICVILHDRLQNDTGRQWDLTRSSETAVEMLDFLDKQASALANVTPRQETESVKTQSDYGMQRTDDGRSYGQSASGVVAKRYMCKVCGKDHALYNCEDFIALNLNGRAAVVRQHNLCAN